MKIVLVVLFVFAFLLTIPRLIMKFRGWRIKGMDAPAIHKESRERIRAGKKTVLYFYTPFCGACRTQEQIINWLWKRYPDAVFKIDASRNRETATAYGVLGVPFTVFIENCKIVKARAGVQRESAIQSFFSERNNETRQKELL